MSKHNIGAPPMHAAVVQKGANVLHGIVILALAEVLCTQMIVHNML